MPATSADADDSPAAPEEPPAVPLLEPRDGVPEVVAAPAALREAAERLAAGTGPVAVDAERASGYRYGQRAYLVQLRRAGAGTVLVDPIAVPELGPLAAALRGTEWVLHAAGQDLPCLREVDLVPDALFDTELAGRLLGFPRVALATLVRQELGLALAKEHSAVDWSRRPLPESWLSYAALDVEVLVALRDRLDEALRAAGKRAWAQEEFEAVRTAPPTPPRQDPWRRLSGMHRLRGRRELAVARQLWYARDRVARTRDTAPGRVLPDAAIITAASHRGSDGLAELPGFTGRGARRHLRTWSQAVAEANALPEEKLPPVTAHTDGPPPPRAWQERAPQAAARLAAVRAAVAAIAEQLSLPAENLLPPDVVKRLAWSPPDRFNPADRPAEDEQPS